MLRHVLTIIGEDKVQQSLWDASAERLHKALCTYLPGNTTLVESAITPLASAEVFLDQFINKVKQHNDPKQQIVFYYQGHGTDFDSAYHLGPNENSLCLNDVLAPLFDIYEELSSLEKRTKVFEFIILIDACYSGKALSLPTNASKTIPIIIISSVPHLSLAMPANESGNPAFSESFSELLEEGIPDAPELLKWEHIEALLNQRIREKNPIMWNRCPVMRQLDSEIYLTQNCIFYYETQKAYLEYLLQEATKLPPFMKNALGNWQETPPDIPRLRQPIEITYGFDGLTNNERRAENETEESSSNPENTSAEARSSSVRQVYWTPTILEDDRFLIAIGEPGSGKSWLAKEAVEYYCHQSLALLNDRDYQPGIILENLPIFFPLGKISPHIDTVTTRSLIELAIKPEGDRFDRLISRILEENKTSGVLVFDGVDEIPQNLLASALIEIGRLSPAEHFSRRVFISCRENRYHSLRDFPGLNREPYVVRMRSLHPVDIRRFAMRFFLFANLPPSMRKIDRLISENLLGNPLHLTMACVVLVYEHKSDANHRFVNVDEIKTRADLIKAASQIMIENWRIWRRGLNSTDVLSTPSEDIYHQFSLLSVHRLLGNTSQQNEIRAEILRTPFWSECGIIIGDKTSQFEFVHRSFFDFFAAEGILLLSQQSQKSTSLETMVDALSWREDAEEAIIDLISLLDNPRSILSLLANSKTDSITRHRLRLAARSLGSLDATTDDIALATQIGTAAIAIYLLLLAPGRASSNSLRPTPGSTAQEWMPSIRSLLYANPRIYETDFTDICLATYKQINSYASSPHLSFRLNYRGTTNHLVAILGQLSAHSPASRKQSESQPESIYDSNLRDLSYLSLSILQVDPSVMQNYPDIILRIIRLLVNDEDIPYFYEHYNILNSEVLGAVSRKHPEEVAQLICHSKSGWELFKHFKEDGSAEFVDKLVHFLRVYLETDQGNQMSAAYTLGWLSESDVLDEEFGATAISLTQRRARKIYAPEWSRISDDNQAQVFEINALQDLCALRNISDIDHEPGFTLLTHRDFRIRARAGRIIRDLKQDWTQYRILQSFAALDRFRFHIDVMNDLHFDHVAPRTSGYDWTPESVTNHGTTEEMKHHVIWSIFYSYIKTYPNTINIPPSFPGQEQDTLIPEDWFNFVVPPYQYSGGLSLIEETMEPTLHALTENCPPSLQKTLFQVDPAILAPMLWGVFRGYDLALSINATIQFGMLFGTDSAIFQLALQRCLFGPEAEQYPKERLQRCANSITWFTPTSISEHLPLWQMKFETVKKYIAEKTAITALDSDYTSQELWASICQLPLPPELLGKAVIRAWTSAHGATYNFPTLLSRALANACRRGFGELTEFQIFYERVISNEREPVAALIEGFSQHPKAIEFADYWYSKLSQRPSWHRKFLRKGVPIPDSLWNRNTKLFMQFVCTARGPAVERYKPILFETLNWILKPPLLFSKNIVEQFKDDATHHSIDTTTLIKAIDTGYAVPSWEKLALRISGVENPHWVFTEPNRLMRSIESKGFRIMASSRKRNLVYPIFNLIHNSIPFIFIIHIYQSTHFIKSEYFKMFNHPITIFKYATFFLIWHYSPLIFKNKKTKSIYHITKLSSIQYQRH